MKYFFSILFSLLSLGLSAQVETPFYSIEEDEVTYEFDVNDFEKFAKDPSSSIHDFSDFDIKNIILSGEYKNWSKDNWTIQRKSRNIYQLRKNLIDFDEGLPQYAKYLIDGEYWHSPTSESKPPALQLPHDVFLEHQSKIVISETGNQTFFLAGHKDAKRVILSGSFNHWHEQQLFLRKTSIGWKLTMDMPPGIYEYKFIVDGAWMHDPSNNLKVLNPHDTYNSILLIGEDVLFTLAGHESAKSVVLSGSFTNWDENCLLYTSPSPRDLSTSRMPSSA